MHLLKWLYPGMKFKRWLLLFSVGVMLVSLGLALVFNYKYLDVIEEAISARSTSGRAATTTCSRRWRASRSSSWASGSC